jgi:hypothetical protein
MSTQHFSERSGWQQFPCTSICGAAIADNAKRKGFIAALTFLMCCYFNFNMSYHSEAAATLDFIAATLSRDP